MDEHDEKLRYPEAAAVTGLEVGTLQSKVSRKQIPHYRLGRRLVVFSKLELLEWMNQHKVATR